MGTATLGLRLARLLAVLPRPVLAALDAWSARVAQRRAERRWRMASSGATRSGH